MKVALSADGRIAAAPGTADTADRARGRIAHPPRARRGRRDRHRLRHGAGRRSRSDGARRISRAARSSAWSSTPASGPRRRATLLDARRRPGHNCEYPCSTSSAAPERAGGAPRRAPKSCARRSGATCRRRSSGSPARGISSLIVEGGARLHRAFWDAGPGGSRPDISGRPRRMGPRGVEWLAGPLASLATVTDTRAWRRYVGRRICSRD